MEEIVAKIDAVDLESVRRSGKALLDGKPTITALGPVDQMPTSDELTMRLRG